VIYLTRDGRRLAAIVPADIVAAEAAMAEPGEDIPGRGGLGRTRHRRRRILIVQA
jgi:hypothetical protein